MSCKKTIDCSDVDCDKGRELGCHSFCCRLLVRLDPEEMEPTTDGSLARGYVQKDKNGNCIHHDLENSLCRIWERRPRVCREYECNSDPLLQFVVKHGFTSLKQLITNAANSYVPKEHFISIPLKNGDSDGGDAD